MFFDAISFMGLIRKMHTATVRISAAG